MREDLLARERRVGDSLVFSIELVEREGAAEVRSGLVRESGGGGLVCGLDVLGEGVCWGHQ